MKTLDEFKRGVLAAAGFASEYDGCSTHRYQLGDCIALKLNVRGGRPRLNRRRLDDPTNTWICGFALALAEMHRRLAGGSDSSGVVEVVRSSGLTLARIREAGASSFDWKELRSAGVG